jgi:hypothetical protein
MEQKHHLNRDLCRRRFSGTHPDSSGVPVSQPHLLRFSIGDKEGQMHGRTRKRYPSSIFHSPRPYRLAQVLKYTRQTYQLGTYRPTIRYYATCRRAGHQPARQNRTARPPGTTGTTSTSYNSPNPTRSKRSHRIQYSGITPPLLFAYHSHYLPYSTNPPHHPRTILSYPPHNSPKPPGNPLDRPRRPHPARSLHLPTIQFVSPHRPLAHLTRLQH